MRKISVALVLCVTFMVSTSSYAHSKASAVRDDRTPTTIYTVTCDFGNGEAAVAETEDASVAQGWLEDCKGLGVGSVEIS